MSIRFISQFAASLFAAIAVCASAAAAEYRSGDIVVLHAVARATVPHQPAGAAYLTLENQGKASDKLTGVSSTVAKSAQIHTMSMADNVMKMREVGSIELKPSEKVTMLPGAGYHLMLIGLKQPLKLGEKFKVRLTFEKAAALEVTVSVEDLSAAHNAGGHKH